MWLLSNNDPTFSKTITFLRCKPTKPNKTEQYILQFLSVEFYETGSSVTDKNRQGPTYLQNKTVTINPANRCNNRILKGGITAALLSLAR